MRQKIFIISGILLTAILLIGLNALSYTQKEKFPDEEKNPNRSTYNTGATGTRAFFELLSETGRKTVRWREKMSALNESSTQIADTFVIIGKTRREISDEDAVKILEWVSQGGKLVLIDRSPHPHLLSTTADWSVKKIISDDFPFDVDPLNQKQMTDQTAAAKSLLPSIYTRNVNAVQPSRFASSVSLEFSGAENSGNYKVSEETVAPPSAEDEEIFEQDEPPPPAPTPLPKSVNEKTSEKENNPPAEIRTKEKFKIGEPPKIESLQTEEPNLFLNAPVVHFAGNNKNILVEMPYGAGEIVCLTDPYVVSNAGISAADNAQAAINLVGLRGGMIAFDEYHQGYGAGENRLLNYFSQTPVTAIFLQIFLLVAVILFTQSRRFARALPADEPNRLSKLEYVSAMAELQQRTKAYDLAIENIYTDFRRRAAKFVGADNFRTTRDELARMIAEKSATDRQKLEDLMFKCEEIIHGEPASRKEILKLAKQLRETEEKIGLKRRRTTHRGV